MTTRLRARAGVLALAVAFAANCTPAPITDRGYQIVFTDQFDGDAVDDVWATAPFGDSLPPTVDRGVLTLTSTAENGYRWGHISSSGPRQESDPSYPAALAWEEGYFEARIRYTDDPWAWPAFWLFSMAKTEAWPNEDCSVLNAEWDIMENGLNNSSGDRPASHSFATVLHRNTTDNTANGYCGVPDTTRSHHEQFPDTNLSNWHTWAGRWTEDEVCTYLDDVEIACLATFDTTAQPMKLVFTIQYARNCGGCPPRPPQLELEVDWVRVWQRP
jgi:beta-glucanase (GH16 family)